VAARWLSCDILPIERCLRDPLQMLLVRLQKHGQLILRYRLDGFDALRYATARHDACSLASLSGHLLDRLIARRAIASMLSSALAQSVTGTSISAAPFDFP
jgi:hypothetical protein